MISNSLLEEIKSELADNFRNDEVNLKSQIDTIATIALSVSNRKDIELLKPYIKECVIGEYLNKGAEGYKSLSEGGKSATFKDLRAEMRSNIIRDGLRVLK